MGRKGEALGVSRLEAGCWHRESADELTRSRASYARIVVYVWLPPVAAGDLPGSTSDEEPACQCRIHKKTQVRSLARDDPLVEGMATHSSILAWRIPRTEEPGGLQSMGSHRA